MTHPKLPPAPSPRKTLANVFAAYPALATFYPDFKPDEQFDRAYAKLLPVLRKEWKSGTINFQDTTYALKHRFERELHTYVPEQALWAALHALGFELRVNAERREVFTEIAPKPLPSALIQARHAQVAEQLRDGPNIEHDELGIVVYRGGDQ